MNSFDLASNIRNWKFIFNSLTLKKKHRWPASQDTLLSSALVNDNKAKKRFHRKYLEFTIEPCLWNVEEVDAWVWEAVEHFAIISENYHQYSILLLFTLLCAIALSCWLPRSSSARSPKNPFQGRSHQRVKKILVIIVDQRHQSHDKVAGSMCVRVV